MTSDPFDRMLDKAEDNYTNGRYREALAAFHRVRSAKDNPYPPGILDSWIGLCHFYLSEWKEATQCLLNSYESINSADYAVVFLQCVAALGELMWRQGDCRKALGFFREGEDLLQIYETNKEWGQHLFTFRLRKGQSHIGLGENAQAIVEFEKCLGYVEEYDLPNDRIPLVRFLLGKGHLFSGNTEKAAIFLDPLASQDLHESYRKEFLFVMIKQGAETNQWPRVIQYFEELEPMGIPSFDGALVYFWVGRAHFFLGHDDVAKKCFELSSSFPNSISWLPSAIRKNLKLISERS